MNLWQRYMLTGAALGLYFGLFFRPVREPSLSVVLGLAVVITIVMALLKLFRKDRPPFPVVLRQMGVNFIKYTLLLALLEGRHLAYDAGGRWATTVFTTASGALFGLWFAFEQAKRSE